MLRSPVRTLQPGEEADLLALCREDPVANVFLAGRVQAVRSVAARRLGGEVWGYFSRNRLVSACWVGANIVPIQATEEAALAFAAKARRSARRAVSIVGPAQAVMTMWDRLADAWGPAREIRGDQPLMEMSGSPRVAPDVGVRVATMSDFEAVVPAAIAMFNEEVGYSPLGNDGGVLYRQRVAELVGGQRTFASFSDYRDSPRRVIFKADLGCVSDEAIQVQGVWVNPAYRGRGLSEGGMAAVVQQCQARGDQRISLYVNGFNDRAIRSYERVGFRRVGTFATILF